jgi:ribosomal protein S27AE
MILFLILVLIIVLGLVFYLFSVCSRQSYRCPQCGEKITDVEHMNAKRCGMCGAPLETTKENS